MGSAWVCTALTFLLSNQHSQVLEVGPQFLHVGHLDFDRDVQGRECKIAAAAALVILDLTQLDRIFRANRDDRDLAAAIVVEKPGGGFRSHCEDQVDFVCLRKFDRFRAACVVHLEIDHGYGRVDILCIEFLQDLGDRDVVCGGRPRIEHQDALR
jgi:hypothetical protein